VPLIVVLVAPVQVGGTVVPVVLGQTLGTAAGPPGRVPPQVPIGQVVGQFSVPPQPSPIVPQYWPPPASVQVIFLQLGSPQTLATPWPPQVAGAVQFPQSSDPPQPSPIMPQYREVPTLQVVGTQPGMRQMFDVQTWPFGQAPQSSVRPQPSPMLSQ